MKKRKTKLKNVEDKYGFKFVIPNVLGKARNKKAVEEYIKDSKMKLLGRFDVVYLRKMLSKLKSDNCMIGVYEVKGKVKQLAPLHCKGYFLAPREHNWLDDDKEF